MARNRKPLASLLTILLAIHTLVGCTAVTTERRNLGETINTLRSDILSSGELSEFSVQFLRMEGFVDYKKDDPQTIANHLRALEVSGEEGIRRDFALSEFTLGTALSLAKSDRGEDALPWFLQSAETSFAALGLEEGSGREHLSRFDPRSMRFEAYYAAAIAGLIEYLNASGWDSFPRQITSPSSVPTELILARGENIIDPAKWDELLVAAKLTFSGLVNRHRRFGLGLGIIACRKKDPEAKLDAYLPLVGICSPISALVTFERPKTGTAKKEGGERATLYLYHSVYQEGVKIAGEEIPLAADFSAPNAYFLEKTGITELTGIERALVGEGSNDWTGFRMVEPYDENKIPLITVHGLLSSPLTWINVHNDLMGDPIIRKHYQIWHYQYPTGLPILLNAATFREHLDKLYEVVAGSMPRKNMEEMVVLSHSMGGLLSTSIVAKNNEPIVKDLLVDSPERLEIDQQGREELASLIDFKRRPYIKRIIFVAVPHRGSLMSESFVGLVGRTLTALPARAVELVTTAKEKYAKVLRPEAREKILTSDGTSIAALSPYNPVIQAIANVAIDEGVPFHSIIGDQGSGLKEESTDGVVPYKSSHLDGAQSEVIVPADHSAHGHPLAVKEIKRILMLHLNGSKSQSTG